MIISKRKYYCDFIIALMFVGVLIFIGTPIVNKYFLHKEIINEVCLYAITVEIIILIIVIIFILIRYKGLKNFIVYHKLLLRIENNLISIGAFIKPENKAYVKLPKIKIDENQISISLKNLKIRSILEKYLDSFSTALPDRYIVEDYYITQNNAKIIIVYEDLNNYKPEQYTLSQYVQKVKSIDFLSLYFDKKHIVSLKDYPHFLISGSSGSGKSYLANQLVIQAIVKGWEVIILDIKRSYGLYKNYSDYSYEIDDIIEKLQSVESTMNCRMKELQPKLDNNPNILYEKPMLVVIEEYISLQSALDKKKKDELERLVKNLSVLARQSNIHLIIDL